jgi:hypothetical protein
VGKPLLVTLFDWVTNFREFFEVHIAKGGHSAPSYFLVEDQTMRSLEKMVFVVRLELVIEIISPVFRI